MNDFVAVRVSMLTGFVMMERRGWHDVPVRTNYGGLMAGPAEAIKSVGRELSEDDLMLDVWDDLPDDSIRERVSKLWMDIGTWAEDMAEEEGDDE